jgi:CRP/FNR family cyclic AMP-dependent transcriptional regulator
MRRGPRITMTVKMASPSVSPRRAGTGRSLLALDPELGQLLTPERHAAAERELRVRVSSFGVGEWDGGRLADADPLHLGLLIADGVLAREVVLGDTVSTELLGPGDILRPWHIEGSTQLLSLTIRWNALSAVKLGLIDRRVAATLSLYPEIGAVIVDRLSERAHRLAVTQAISQLNRVDRRLLALFWHLAERWGRVARDGIAVPLVLSHRLIGELVGARRPTVSTALAELAREGQVVRRDDGTWLLTGQPVGVSETAATDVIRQRRRLLPSGGRLEPVGEPVPTAPPPERLAELQTSLEAARAMSQRHREELDALQAETAALRARTVELRARRLQHVADLRAAAERRQT